MAKQKFKLNSNIFIDEYEKEIELSTKRNLDRLEDDKAIRKAHAKIADVLKSENQTENTYLTLENYYNLVKKLKLDKKILLMTTIYDAVYLSVDISISDDYIENLLKKHFEIEYFNGVTFKIDISKGNNMKEV